MCSNLWCILSKFLSNRTIKYHIERKIYSNRSTRLSHSSDIEDAIWHIRTDQNRVVCLTKDNFIRIYNCENFKSSIKEYHLQSIFYEPNFTESKTNRDSKSNDQKVNIDMGMKFTFNGKPAFPIYVLKSSGQIECLIDYES